VNKRLTDDLSHAIRMVADAVTDRELIHRYIDKKDQTAFAQLIRRHASLVHGVCRRALSSPHDAEDACQATFLVLARKAKTEQWQSSIANWLYVTARRVSADARVATKRRAKREGRAAVRPAHEPVDRMTGRELLAALDEELERLPPHYREPLVLCCLEGLTRDEAALRLGIPSATLKSQLERGRKRLADALTKRGHTLGTGLLALATVSNSASSASLATDILAAVAGTSSATVAALANGVVMKGLISKSLLAAVALFSITSMGIGLAVASWSADQQQADKAIPAKNSAVVNEPAKADKTLTQKSSTIRGTVLGPDGKPLPGAKLFIPNNTKTGATSGVGATAELVGTAGAEGQFNLTLTLPDGGGVWARAYLIAHAAGFGVDWVDLNESKSSDEVTFRLLQDVPITGRVVNTEGKPVAGVSVSATSIYVPANEKLDEYLSGWLRDLRNNLGTPRKRLNFALDGITGTVTTDGNGGFTLSGAGAERIVMVTFHGGGVVRSRPYVITRTGFDPKPYNDVLLNKEHDNLRVNNRFLGLYPPSFTFVAEPGKTVEGVIKDATNGSPLAGCTVSSLIGFGVAVTNESDNNGRFHIEGLPKNSRGYGVQVAPPQGSTFLNRNASAADTDGYSPVKLDIEMVKGVVVAGRVIDRQTGKGVQGGVRFAPLPDNRFFASKPGFDNYRSNATMAGTDSDGRFRLVTIPGKALVMAQVHEGEKFNGDHLSPYRRAVADPDHKDLFTYDKDIDSWTVTSASGSVEFTNVEHAVKVIDIKDTGETVVELVVDRGVTAQLTVQDAEGNPLAGAWVAGLTDHSPITYKLPEATATVFALNPEKPRILTIYHPEKNLGGTITIRSDEKEPLVAKLDPAGRLTGRLLDLDGSPLVGAQVSIGPQSYISRDLYQKANPTGKPIRTDKDGRFTLTGIVPGISFSLQTQREQAYFRGNPRIGWRQLKPGETLDLGDWRMEPIR